MFSSSLNNADCSGLYCRVQALGICQGLVDAKWLESITGDDVFRDEYLLYRPGEVCATTVLNTLKSIKHTSKSHSKINKK